jgi:RNA 2',3'-cyclic 3'-phosphodiesterase
VRCFVAVDVSPAVREALAARQAALARAAGRADVRWVDPERVHLTLRFLGETPEARLDGLIAALRTASAEHPVLHLAARGVGGFPTITRPRVVWVGVDGDVTELVRLAGAVALALAPLGFPPETRPFSAHLTVGRVRSPRGLDRLVKALVAAGRPDLGAWTADEVVLYRSHLHPQGATYEALARLPLKKGMRSAGDSSARRLE